MTLVIAAGQGCTPQRSAPETGQYREQATDANFIEYCKTHECRKDLKIHLKKPDGSYFDYQMELAQPIVQDKTVSIFPGETIYIAFDPGEKGPENLRSVKSADGSTNTLTFKFTQEPELFDGVGMMLFINNPTKYSIEYDFGMMLIDSEDLFETSSVPLMPGLSNFESWPHPIFQLIMTNFRWAE